MAGLGGRQTQVEVRGCGERVLLGYRDGVGRAQTLRDVSRLKAVGLLPPPPFSDPKPSAPATGGRENPTTGARARTA